MTDYDNMPAGEEMDVEVARLVFGQTDFSHLPVVYEEGNTPDGKDGWSGFVCPRCRNSSDGLSVHKCVQSYSTDSAWQILYKLGLHVGRYFFNDGWYCSSKHDFNDKDNIISVADTPQLAICRTAVKVCSPKVY